jgi:hypothetical protein
MTQYNLGLAYRDSAKFDESATAVHVAARGFESVGDEEGASQAKREAEQSRRLKRPETEPR